MKPLGLPLCAELGDEVRPPLDDAGEEARLPRLAKDGEARLRRRPDPPACQNLSTWPERRHAKNATPDTLFFTVPRSIL